MKTFDSGAKSSEAAPRLDLIPVAALLRLAARMALGATSHGARNYERGIDDPAFIMDRKNHLMLHCVQYVAGDTSDDHLGAILANAAMLARLEELSDAKTDTYLRQKPDGNTPGHEQATYISVQDATVFSHNEHAAPMTYDEKRAAAQPCLGGCGFLVQNATTCHTCRSLEVA